MEEITSNELMDQAAEKAEQLLNKIDFHADDAAYQALTLITDLVGENLDARQTASRNYDDLWKLIYDPAESGSWDYPGQIIVHLRQFIKEKDELIAAQQARIKQLEIAAVLSSACLSERYGDEFSEGCPFSVNLALAAIEACGAFNVNYPQARKEIAPLLETK